MSIRIHNNLTKEEEELPDQPLLWYVCGPTVYDSSHLGHARTYLTIDIIRRILRDYFHQNSTLVMNITNVDDKIINRAQEQQINFLDLANQYEASFFKEMGQLNIEAPDVITRVTDYMDEMIKFIQRLLNQKDAYEANGSVYFDMTKYLESGGQLLFFPNRIEDQQVSDHRNEKRNQADFALWKASKSEKEPSWNVPWSETPGRPGWHLECSAMSVHVSEQLGLQGKIDMHSGGIDLAFPHHQNEILQSQAYLRKTLPDETWCPVFLHIGHLDIKGLKMSKSLKNFITIESFLKENHPDVLRMLFLMHPYQKSMSYDPEESLQYAEALTSRVINLFKFLANYRLEHRISTGKFETDELDNLMVQHLDESKIAFDLNLRDNFNTGGAMSEVMGMIDKLYDYIEKGSMPKLMVINRISEWIREMYLMFGFDDPRQESNSNTQDFLDVILKIRNEIRDAAKATKSSQLFVLSDKIRDQYLKELGVSLQDLK